MLINTKQQFIKKTSLLFLSSILLLGCTNMILYPVPTLKNESVKVLEENSGKFLAENNITENNAKTFLSQYQYDFTTIKTSDNENLSAVEFITKEEQAKGVVLFLHGNNDDIYKQSLLNNALLFLESGYNLLVLDYRGYGKSTGSPSPKGLNLDIQATVKYLTKEYTNIYIYAQSIGGTSLLGALDEINQSKIRAIATEGSFLSYKQLSKAVKISIPFTNYKEIESYAPLSTKRDLNLPLLLIHSIEDEVIPYSQGKALHAHFKNSKHIATTGRHLGYLTSSIELDSVLKFYDENKDYQAPIKIKPTDLNTSTENNISTNKELNQTTENNGSIAIDLNTTK